MTRKSATVGLAVALMGLATASGAATWTATVTGHDHITGPQGQQRILLQLAGPQNVEDMAIERAVLQLPVPAAAPTGLELRLYPILTNWSPGTVDWTAGWNEPGGDIDRESYGRTVIASRHRGGTVEVDVTALLLSIRGGDPTFGLMLTAPVERAEGLPPAARQALQGLLEGTTLEVSYRTSRRPGSRT